MMTFLNPALWLVAIGLMLGTFFGGVSVGKKWEEGRHAIESNHIAEAVDAANNAAAEAIAQIKPKYTTIQNAVEKEIRTETVFKECLLPPEAVRLVNSALSPEPVSSQQPLGSTQRPSADK